MQQSRIILVFQEKYFAKSDLFLDNGNIMEYRILDKGGVTKIFAELHGRVGLGYEYCNAAEWQLGYIKRFQSPEVRAEININDVYIDRTLHNLLLVRTTHQIADNKQKLESTANSSSVMLCVSRHF